MIISTKTFDIFSTGKVEFTISSTKGNGVYELPTIKHRMSFRGKDVFLSKDDFDRQVSVVESHITESPVRVKPEKIVDKNNKGFLAMKVTALVALTFASNICLAMAFNI